MQKAMNLKWKTIVMIVFFSWGILGCQDNIQEENEKIMPMRTCYSSDSLKEYFLANESKIDPLYLSFHVQKLIAKNRIPEAKKLDSFYTEYTKNTPNKKIAFYYLIDKGYQSMAYPGQIKTKEIFNQLKDLNQSINDTLISVVYQTCWGSYLFVTNQLDSAKRTFENAYQLSVRINNKQYMQRLCNNLGSISLRLKQYRNARYYLSKAHLLMKENKENNPVLISNLATTYMSEGNYLQAKKTLIDDIKNNKTNNEYTDQLLQFNLAMVYQNLNEFSESQKIINLHCNKPINAALKPSFFVIQFNQASAGGIAALNEFIKKNSPITPEMRYSLLEYYKSSLKEQLKKQPSIIQQLGYTETELMQPEYSQLNYEKNEILALIAISQGNYAKAYQHKQRSNEALDQLNSTQKLNTESEIDLAIHNVELDHFNQQLKSENSYKSKQILLTNIILILSVIFTAFVIYLWRKNAISQKKQLETTQELLETKIESERLQINENQLNEKLFSLSKLIVEKSIQFANELKQSDVAKNPKIIEIRRGLERLADIDETFEKTKTELSNDAMYKTIFDSYPDLQTLSVNGKKVLILSIQGYKPKEIAAMLDLSYDYVRNLKTKLNQIFAANGISGFQQLKEMA